MREVEKYGVLKEKLKGICEEHDLVFTIHNQGYPFRMTIKPTGGMDAQQTMLEAMDNGGETGYISPDASLVFVYKDGELSYKISETWTISATLFNKLKNLFMKLRDYWFGYFFRDIHEHSPSALCVADPTAVCQDADTCTEEDEDSADAFADFMDEAEPAVEDAEVEE